MFSPERVLTGRVFADLRRYPKLVGGIDAESEKRGIEFYRDVLDFDLRSDLTRPNGVWAMGSSEAAEMAKLAETTYRDVNIGLANQFALFAESHGINVNGVIDACNSQPYSHIHAPGIAVGGHCIPVYPRLYLWNDPSATVVSAAREANALMPYKVVARLEQVVASLSGVTVAVLGAAYRGGVKETAFSGVFPTVDAMKARREIVSVHDPIFSDEEIGAMGFKPYHRGEPIDVLVLQADHEDYRQWRDQDCPGVKTVVDGRAFLDPAQWQGVRKFIRIGV